MSNIILTGATGIIGSHLLYELIEQRLSGEASGQLILLVRPTKVVTAHDRIAHIVSHDYIPVYLKKYTLKEMMSTLDIISCNFMDKNLGEKLAKYKGLGDCKVIHSAASTNLATTEAAREENHTVNYLGSINLLKAVTGITTKLIYISTAYACGRRTGNIPNEYSQLTDFTFRNPYEEIKNAAERKLAIMTTELGIKYQILRPGVVVGRLIDEPYYFLPKYNVIYAFGNFFHSLTQKEISVPINVISHENAHLHLISVDYVAKVIAHLYNNDIVNELNIVPQKGVDRSYIAKMLEIVGYDNYTFVNEKTPAQNKIERVYQSKVEDSFGAYISEAEYTYDNELLLSLTAHISMPDVSTHYDELITFAREQGFRSS